MLLDHSSFFFTTFAKKATVAAFAHFSKECPVCTGTPGSSRDTGGGGNKISFSVQRWPRSCAVNQLLQEGVCSNDTACGTHQGLSWPRHAADHGRTKQPLKLCQHIKADIIQIYLRRPYLQSGTLCWDFASGDSGFGDCLDLISC